MKQTKKNALLGSAITLFVLSLLNKGLGFLKSMAIASVYGATQQTDAYYVAEGLMQNVLIPVSEAVAVSFLPIYMGIKERNHQEAKGFASRAITDIFLLAFVLTGILYVAAPLIMKIILPTYSAAEVELSVSYFRILIWGMCFYMSNQMLQSLLNAEKAYGFSSFTAMLNNLILTFAVLLLGRHFGLRAMAVAVPFSYLAQYVVLQIKSRKYGGITWRYGFRDSWIRKLCVNALPIFFGNAIWELNQLVDRSLLSAMEEGSVTAVSYAAVLYQFASNLIGIPLTTIIYTELAESFAAGRKEEGAAKLVKGIHISLFLCIPISLFILLTANQIVQITYGRGAFDAQAVVMTAQGLRYYGLCLLAYCLNALLVRACYSLGDTALPMKVGLGAVSLNVVLSILLSRFMGLSGVVLATAVANTLSSTATLVIVNRTKLALHLRRFVIPGTKRILASAVSMGLCALWIHSGCVSNDIALFVTSACVMFGAYAAFAFAWKDEIAMEFVLIVKSRFARREKE